MSKKYVFTDKTVKQGGKILHRIKAVRSFGVVREGDLGGWIEHESNLSHDGNCWVYDIARVFGDAYISGNASVKGKARVYNQAQVAGNASIRDSVLVYGQAKIWGGATLYGECRIYGSAEVYGGATVFGKAEVLDNSKISGNCRIYGYAQIYEDAIVTGSAWLNEDARAGAGAYVDRGEHGINTRLYGNVPQIKKLRAEIAKNKTNIDILDKMNKTIGHQTNTELELLKRLKGYLNG